MELMEKLNELTRVKGLAYYLACGMSYLLFFLSSLFFALSLLFIIAKIIHIISLFKDVKNKRGKVSEILTNLEKIMLKCWHLLFSFIFCWCLGKKIHLYISDNKT